MRHCKSAPKNAEKVEMHSISEKITGHALGAIALAMLAVIALSAAA